MLKNFRSEEIKFGGEIKEIIISNFFKFTTDNVKIELSSSEEDTEESFDLIFNSEIEISVRIRDHYYLQYSDFTIRSRAKNGGRTEIDKLKDGKGNIYLYAWKSENKDSLYAWALVDIKKIRSLFSGGITRQNEDGTRFKVYSFKQIKELDGIIAYKHIRKRFL